MVEAVKIWLSSPLSGFGVIRSEQDLLVFSANAIEHSAVSDNREMPGLLVDGRGGIAPAFQDKLQFFQLYRSGLVAAHTPPLEDVLDRFVQFSLPKTVIYVLLIESLPEIY